MAFNLVGYKILFIYLEEHAHRSMAIYLDEKTYDPSALTEIRVALHLPYSLSNDSFERCDGSIVIDSRSYNYVERKVQNDTLILHCIPNKQADKIKLAYADYGKKVQSSHKSPNEGHSLLLLKSFDVAGFDQQHTFVLRKLSFSISSPAYTHTGEKLIDDKFASSPEQPPDPA